MKRDKNGKFIKGGISYWRGKHLTQNARTKLKKANLGKKYSNEVNKKKGRKGIAHPFWGKKLSEKHRKNLVRVHTGVKLSEYHRRKQGEGKTGEKNPNWKGGITPMNLAARMTFEYKQWRTVIFEREKYTCQHCGAKSGKGKIVVLNADHIKPFSRYPDLRLNLDNGRTLCVNCHKKIKKFFGNQYIKS